MLAGVATVIMGAGIPRDRLTQAELAAARPCLGGIAQLFPGNGSAGASDLFVGLNAVVFMNSNIVGTFGGDLGDVVQQNTLTANPGFNSTNGVGLSASSIARNSGAAVVVGGNAALDFSGERRTQGSRIDRGAYEFSELFANGFE